MPQKLLINDFNAGWLPTDDPVGSKKPGLLKSANVKIDRAGAVIMTGGGENIFATNYPADAHSLFAKFISGTQVRYLGLTDGKVYRNETQLSAGGSTSRMALATAYNYAFVASGNYRIKDTGAAATNLGISPSTVAPTVTSLGAGTFTGDLEYAEMVVANFTGAYVAKSALSPLGTISVEDEAIEVTGSDDPANYDSQANELWIFRRGGALEQFYRVKKLTSAYTTPFEDTVSDEDALLLNITASEYISPVNSTGIPDAVLEMVGLVYERMLYFTKNAIYISELNSPDSYDTRQVRYYAGNGTVGTELFLWARQVGPGSVMIGTTKNCYIMSGSFVTMPDGFLDVSLIPLGVARPPISIHADMYGGGVVSMSADGWRIYYPTGESVSIVNPAMEALYSGKTLNGHEGIPIFIYPTLNYQCAVSHDKLFVVIPTIVNNDPLQAFSSRMECYDFTRKAWRQLSHQPTAIVTQEDDALSGFFSSGGVRKLKYIESVFDQTLDDVNQTITLCTLFHDNGSPNTRKTPLSLSLRVDTGGSNLTLRAYKDGNISTSYSITTTLNSSGLSELHQDISSLFSGTFKNIALEITGACADFRLIDFTVFFEQHPEPLRYFKLFNYNFGELNGRKKKLRVWPLTIDTLGQNVVLTPYIDGGASSTTTINTSRKQTVFHYFLADGFTLDLDMVLQASTPTPFELWDIGQPDIVQVLPIGKKFDQIGPIELFRYGRIKQLEIRLLTFEAGSVDFDYFLYINDVLAVTDTYTTTTSDDDQIINIPFPKTTGGDIVKLVIGPTDFVFHRLSARILTQLSGKDTENTWIDLNAQ